MPSSLPPGPDLPAWEQVRQWIEDPVGFWEACAARHGETFTVQLGSLGPTVLFSRPEDVRQIFRLLPTQYECRPYNEHYKLVMGARSLLVSDGAEHRRRRQLLGPALMPRALEGAAAIVRAVTGAVVEAWPVGEPLDVLPSAHAISLQVMLTVTFGETYRSMAREISGWFASEIRPDLRATGPWSQFVRLQPRLRTLISEAVERGRATSETRSSLLFDALISARDEAGQGLDVEEIQDHLFSMLVAGVDPAALALAWALYWVASTPEVGRRLRDERVALGPDPDPDLIAEQPYLTAVCRESLRMYPVVTTPTGRRLTAPVRLGGWEFEAGVTLLPCTYLVHRRPDLYPEADRFRPERFLERDFGPHEFLPFGGGHRYCVGANLGLLEMKLALATILSRWELEPACAGPVRPVRYGTLLAPPASAALIVSGPASGTTRRQTRPAESRS